MVRAPATGDARAAVRSGAFLTATQVFTRTVQLGFVVVATRAVSEGEFGRFSVSSGLLILGGLVADLGLGPAVTRLTSRHPDRARAYIEGLLLPSAAIGLLGWAMAVGVAAVVYGRIQAVDVGIMASSLPFFSVNTALYASLDGTGRMPTRSIIAALQPLVAAGIAAILVLTTHDIRAAMWCAPVGAATATLVGLVVLRRAGLFRSWSRPSRGVLRDVFRLAVPFAVLSGLGSLTARFDLLFLGAHEGPKAAASYDLALRSCEALWYLQTVVTAPTMVLLSRRLGQNDVEGARRAYDGAIRISYFTGLAISVLVVVMADPITTILGGTDYEHSATALAISGAVVWLSYITFVQGTLVLAGDHLRAGLATATGLTVVTLAVDVALILPFGVRGAAAAAAIGVVLTAVGCGVLHHRTLGWTTAPPPLRLVVVALVAVAAGISLDEAPILAAVAAASIYCGGSVLSGAIGINEIRALLTSVRSRHAI